MAHRAELRGVLEHELTGETASTWQAILSAAGVPTGQVGDIGAGLDYAERLGLDPTIEVYDSRWGIARASGAPPGAVAGRGIRASGARPPRLDEHGDAVRAWLDGA